MNKKILIFFIFVFQTNILNIYAGSAGKNYTYETQEIVLFPTAGMATNGNLFNLSCLGNILVLSAEKSLQNDLSIGVSLAVRNLLGNNNSVSIKDYPAIKVKYRLLNEGKSYPAILLGFDSQTYLDFPNRTGGFHHHSIGPFIAMSKAFSWQLGIIGFHLGANFPIEYNANRRGNFFFGIEHTINKDISCAIEYSFDSDSNLKGLLSDGITNFGFKYSVDRNVTLNLYLIDIFSTKMSIYRVINLQFVAKIF